MTDQVVIWAILCVTTMALAVTLACVSIVKWVLTGEELLTRKLDPDIAWAAGVKIDSADYPHRSGHTTITDAPAPKHSPKTTA